MQINQSILDQLVGFLSNLIFGTASSTDAGVGTSVHLWLVAFVKKSLYYFLNFFIRFSFFSFIFSTLMIVLIAYYIIKSKEMRKIMIDKIPNEDTEIKSVGSMEKAENRKWKLVQEHINSDDPSKWRLSILEADIILDDVLGSLNLPGDSIGEKLKAVEKGDFISIEEAWEAHKIRNAIAHEGSDFLLNQREARRVIDLYKKVFEEFNII